MLLMAKITTNREGIKMGKYTTLIVVLLTMLVNGMNHCQEVMDAKTTACVSAIYSTDIGDY